MGIFEPISSGLNFIQGHYERKLSRENTDKTIQANKEQAEYAYNKDLEMWNRGNEYNTPQAQMQRLKKAGLNPNMIYGSGKSTGNTSSQLPKYQNVRQDYNYKFGHNLPAMISQYQDVDMKNAQIDNVKKQTDNQVLKNNLLSGTMDYEVQIRLSKMLQEKFKVSEAKANSIISQENAKIARQKLESELARTNAQADYSITAKALKQQELNLLKQGVTKGDNALLRWWLQNKDKRNQYWNDFKDMWFDSQPPRQNSIPR